MIKEDGFSVKRSPPFGAKLDILLLVQADTKEQGGFVADFAVSNKV